MVRSHSIPVRLILHLSYSPVGQFASAKYHAFEIARQGSVLRSPLGAFHVALRELFIIVSPVQGLIQAPVYAATLAAQAEDGDTSRPVNGVHVALY